MFHILCPIVIWFMMMMLVTTLCFTIRDGIKRLKQLHQIPCDRCAFFATNQYLKCAIHPCKVLSESAIDCLDYEPFARRGVIQSFYQKIGTAD